MRDAWHVPTWPLTRRVGALTTVRTGGESRGAFAAFNLARHVGDSSAAVAANRARLCDELGLARIQWLNQVHGTRCLHATPDTVASVPEADAAWTRERRLALAVLTADCLPVVVADRGGAVVGIAHAGWRGLVHGVLESLVAALPVAPDELVAWIGPGIGARAYEVGEDVAGPVADLVPADEAAVLSPGARPGKHQLDLAALAGVLLARSGVPAVFTEGLCTYEDPRFYSYRRDGTTGRMATLAWLR